MNKPVNVYGSTSYYEDGLLECVFDGFGYRDNNGNITWYDNYNPPKDDDFYFTTVIPYGNGCDLAAVVTCPTSDLYQAKCAQIEMNH